MINNYIYLPIHKIICHFINNCEELFWSDNGFYGHYIIILSNLQVLTVTISRNFTFEDVPSGFVHIMNVAIQLRQIIRLH